jgi:serine/threonine protein kinase
VVADFGMSRELQVKKKEEDANIASCGGEDADAEAAEHAAELYYTTAGGVIPIRWAAVEVLSERRFSEKSDVWSFAITCIEVFTDAALPYTGMKNEEVYHGVLSGDRMHRPPECPANVYEAVITPAWEADPHKRVTFQQIGCSLQNILREYGIISAALEERNERAHCKMMAAFSMRSASSAAAKTSVGAVDNCYLGLEGNDGRILNAGQDLEPKEIASSNASRSESQTPSNNYAILTSGVAEVCPSASSSCVLDR